MAYRFTLLLLHQHIDYFQHSSALPTKRPRRERQRANMQVGARSSLVASPLPFNAIVCMSRNSNERAGIPELLAMDRRSSEVELAAERLKRCTFTQLTAQQPAPQPAAAAAACCRRRCCCWPHCLQPHLLPGRPHWLPRPAREATPRRTCMWEAWRRQSTRRPCIQHSSRLGTSRRWVLPDGSGWVMATSVCMVALSGHSHVVGADIKLRRWGRSVCKALSPNPLQTRTASQ